MAAILAALSLAVGGCATTSAPLGDVSPTPAADAVTTAVMRSKGLGTAAIRVQAVFPGGVDQRDLTATGVVDLDEGTGRLLVNSGDSDLTEVLVTGRGAFARPEGAPLWARLEDPEAEPGVTFVDPFAGLGTIRDVRRREVTGLGTRYDGILPAGAGGDAAVSVWVDDSGRIARIDRALDGADGSSTVSTTLTDYRVRVDLSSPPSASVASTEG